MMPKICLQAEVSGVCRNDEIETSSEAFYKNVICTGHGANGGYAGVVAMHEYLLAWKPL